MHPDALKARSRSWRGQPAVCRQHAFAVLRRMGRPVPSDSSTCFLCHERLDAEKPMDHLDPHTGVVINDCGHVLHILCQMTWASVQKLDCAVCAANKAEGEAASLTIMTSVNMAQSVCALVHLSSLFEHLKICAAFGATLYCVGHNYGFWCCEGSRQLPHSCGVGFS